MVFVEYLTQWVEAYVVTDQTSGTLARLLVKNVICGDSHFAFASWGAFLHLCALLFLSLGRRHSVYGSVGLTMCS